MKTTVFKSGGSQAVRIPKEFRFDAKSVEIERRGASLILTPSSEKKKWPEGYIDTIIANAADTDFVRHPQGEHREIIW
jgi:antitoxin VapB